MNMRVLLACKNRQQCQSIVRWLADAGWQTDLCTTVRDSERQLQAMRSAGQYYRLILVECSADMPQGPDLITRAKQFDPRTRRCALVDPYNAAVNHRAKQAPAQYRLDWPLIPTELLPLLDELKQLDQERQQRTGTTHRHRSGMTTDDPTPFFGTSRRVPSTTSLSAHNSTTVTRGQGSSGSRFSPNADSNYYEPPAGTEPLAIARPINDNEQHQDGQSQDGQAQGGKNHNKAPSHDPFEDQLQAPKHRPRARQQLEPSTGYDSTGQSSAGQGSTRTRTRVFAGTTRVRRSITGSLSNEQQERQHQHQTKTIGSNARHVRCAHCAQAFQVAERQSAYTTPCVHCGGLNTITAAA